MDPQCWLAADGTARSSLDGRKHEVDGTPFQRDGIEMKDVGVGEKQCGTHAGIFRSPEPPPPAHHQKCARAETMTYDFPVKMAAS